MNQAPAKRYFTLDKITREFLSWAAAFAVLASPFVLYTVAHDLLAVRNTTYSPKFNARTFERIGVGTPRATVIELLGPSFQTDTLTNYPAWAIRDAGFRKRHGMDDRLQIETLSFSQPKERRCDYDFVSVWIGPNNNVIQRERGITD